MLGHPRAASKVTKAVIKATTRLVTNFSTKSTKVVIKGGTRAREKDTKVDSNEIKIAQRVKAVNKLQIIVKSLLENMKFLIMSTSLTPTCSNDIWW